MTSLYKIGFDIQSSEVRGLALLTEVQSVVHEWAKPRFSNIPNGPGLWSNGNETLQIDVGTARNHGFLSVKSTLESGFQLCFKASTIGNEIDVFLDMSHTGVQGASATLGQPRQAPVLIDILARNFNCSVGNDPLVADPEIVTLNDFEQFIENEMFGTRVMPIVVISTPIGKSPIIDANDLQRKLLGIARVFSYNASTANTILGHLSERRCRRLACYGGAVRLYKHGCAPESPSRDHPV